MEKVRVNIFKYAIEANDHNGRIIVAAGLSPEEAFLSIENTGADVIPEVSAKLFTPFFTANYGGQGMGLTFAAEVLPQHGFRHILTSESGATRFCIIFS